MTAFTALPFGMIGNRRGVPALQRQAPMLNQQPYQQPVSMADAPVAAPAMPTTQMRSTGVTTEPVEQPKPAPRKRGGMFSGGRGLMLLGAGLRDMDGTMGSNNFNTMLSYVTEQQEEERLRMEKEAREAAMLAAMPNLTPEQRALFAANPSGVFDAATEMAFAPPRDPMVVGAGAAVVDRDGNLIAYNPKVPDAAKPNVQLVEMIGPQGPGYYAVDKNNVGATPQYFGQTIPSGLKVRVDANGAVEIVDGDLSGLSNNASNRLSSEVLGDSLQDAGATDRAYSLLRQAEGIIKRGNLNTGALNRVRTNVAAIADELPPFSGLIDDAKLADSEQFRAINNQLAAAMLEMFGGSDTERELQISVMSNIGPDLSDETNRAMLPLAIQFVEVQRQKPEFQSQWIENYGGVDKINPETGLGMQASWDQYLQGQHNNIFMNVANPSQDALQNVVEGDLPQVTNEQEYNALPRGTRFIDPDGNVRTKR